MNEGGISLDDLAAMVASGFSDVQGQVSDLRGELQGFRGEVERRFDRLERDMAEVKYLLTDTAHAP